MLNLSENAANNIFYYSNVFVIVGLVTGLVGGAGAIWAGGLRDKFAALQQSENDLKIAAAKSDAAIANKAAAEANEGLAKATLDIEDRKKESSTLGIKLANAERETLELKRRFAPRVELLTPKVRQKLIDNIKIVPWANVRLVTIQNTKEASEFGDAIAQLINDAGRIVHREVVAFSVESPLGIQGVQIRYIGNKPPEIANRLADTLRNAGIPSVQMHSVDAFSEMDAHVELYVGVRE
jgi:hypothetical protein